MKKVSIIVPVYNTAHYLEKCLESLTNQNFQDYEVIVIDDGSNDGSACIIEDYVKKNPHLITYIKQENKGIGKTRNLGIQMASGEFICFIDSDDYVSPNLLKDTYEFAINNHLDVVIFDINEVRENKILLDSAPSFEVTSYEESPTLFFELKYGPCNKLFRLDLLKQNSLRFPEQLKYEDLGYIPIIMASASKIGKLNAPYYYYVIHENSQSTILDRKVYDIFKILDILNDYFKGNPNFPYLQEELEFLNVTKVFIYTIKQKYQKNKGMRNEFIDASFSYLDLNYPNWRKNKYWARMSIFKRIIKKHKKLTKLYCSIYQLCFQKGRG